MDEQLQLRETGRRVLVTHQPPLAELKVMAAAIAGSKMFGVTSEDQALALMLLCQAEGIHPVMALRRYHIIDNKPAMRADALQGEFEKEGAILWHFRTDQICAATFYRDKRVLETDKGAVNRGQAMCEQLLKASNKEAIHVTELIQYARVGEVTILRTFQDAVDKGLATTWDKDKQEYVLKKNWRQSPRQMLHARVLTEGVRAINPGLIAGVYAEEELIDVEAEVTPVQQPTQEIIERNVREATANATGEQHERDSSYSSGHEQPSNEYGPLEITQDNYKELVSHVGQAQGSMLGKKIGELPRNIIEWMYSKWRGNLRPTATDQDLRLKKAIEFAYADLEKPEDLSCGDSSKPTPAMSGGARNTNIENAVSPEPMTPAKAEAILRGDGPKDVGAKAAAIADLRGRIEDLMITEAQAMRYLREQGVSNQNWRTLDDLPESMLLVLCTPKMWGSLKDVIEADLKPKPPEPKAKRTRRKKA